MKRVPHVRERQPRVGTPNYWRKAQIANTKTLCGAPITIQDIDYATANTRQFRSSGWPVCPACVEKLTPLPQAPGHLEEAQPHVESEPHTISEPTDDMGDNLVLKEALKKIR